MSRLQALLTNIRVSWKGLLGTSTLVNYELYLMMALKSFIAFGPGFLTHE
jgi:hypothetical protein